MHIAKPNGFNSNACASLLYKEGIQIGTGGKITIHAAAVSDLPDLHRFINNRPSHGVVDVSEETLRSWIDSGCSLIARQGASIIGHTAVDYLGIETAHGQKLAGAELRTQLVSLNGAGIYTALTMMALEKARMLGEDNRADDTRVYVHKGPGSGGSNLLHDLRFLFEEQMFMRSTEAGSTVVTKVPTDTVDKFHSSMRRDATKRHPEEWPVAWKMLSRLTPGEIRSRLIRDGWIMPHGFGAMAAFNRTPSAASRLSEYTMLRQEHPLLASSANYGDNHAQSSLERSAAIARRTT